MLSFALAMSVSTRRSVVMSRFVAVERRWPLDRRGHSRVRRKCGRARRADLLQLPAPLRRHLSGSAQDARFHVSRRTGGRTVPAREYPFPRRCGSLCGDRCRVPARTRPVVDDAVVEHAAEQIRRRAARINQQFKEPYDPGMPGRQLNITYPNGKQLRASIYMANRHLTITEAMRRRRRLQRAAVRAVDRAHRREGQRSRSAERHRRTAQFRLQQVGPTTAG